MIKSVNIKLNRNNLGMSELLADTDKNYMILIKSEYPLLEDYLSDYTSGRDTLLRVVQRLLCFEDDYMKITEDKITLTEV